MLVITSAIAWQGWRARWRRARPMLWWPAKRSRLITFSFRIGNDAYDWDWDACSKDTEAEDGIGLPGHHGCGDERILDSAPYVG